MAGWGLVGLGGAALAVLTRRRLGRVGLAVACGLAGLAYGALLDLSVMVTYGGEQSLDRYLALSARGIPFNVAHAVGNVVLALAAGPALVRMISRYRSRFEFTWRQAPARPRGAGECRAKRGRPSCPLLLVAVAATRPSRPGQRRRPPMPGSGSSGRRTRDGGFGPSPDADSSAAITGWAALGLESAGRNPLDVRRGGRVADRLPSLAGRQPALDRRPGAHHPGARGGGGEPAPVRRPRPGGGASQATLTERLVRRPGEPDRVRNPRPARRRRSARQLVARSAAWLREAQNGDGGWGFQPQAGSDPDSTGAALQALVAAGGRGRATARGASYLRRAQRANGGFALAASGGPRTRSPPPGRSRA